jgi:transcription antitermination factor NusG
MQVGSERSVMKDLTKGESRPGRKPRPAFETLLLLTRVFEIKRGKRVPGAVAMLAGYGFVRFDAARVADWIGVLACPGVRELMMSGGSLRPQPVSDRVVARLAKLSVRDPDRIVGAPSEQPPREVGDNLTCLAGPFTGFAAVVDTCDGFNTTAWVSIFGRSTPVTLPYACFEAA